MGLMGISLMHHVCIVLLSLGLLSHFNYCNPVAYIVSLLYLYLVHELYVMRLRRKLQYEERKQSNQRRVFSDSETVRWLNHAVERIWPVCMEQIASQKILLPIIPWFLEKYKPWTARKAVVQHLYLGRNAPLFTDMRVIRECSDDDHLVLELGMNFLTAEDMSAILAVKLRKRLGFGMWTKLHITGMHVEGKVLIGVKFLRHWPFLGRLRVCFAEPPYFQMTVKPIFTHGLDVTELPGIAGWLDKLLSSAFEQTLVEPNMLVVDVEKFASPQPENWFSVDEKDPIAFVKIEVVEASDMKPSDLNGLADPYVKGQIGPYRFRTNTQKKTLAPKWHEEFKIPICTWESPNLLVIEVRDKDHFVDDTLGDCTVSINEFRDGQRHDIWLPLQNIKMGRLHLAVTVLENIAKRNNGAKDGETLNKEDVQKSCGSGTALRDSFSSVSSEKSSNMLDNFEAINVEGQQDTGIWVHQPGSEVSQKWEPRKGKGRCLETQIHRAPNISSDIIVPPASGSFNIDSSSSDENNAGKDSGGRVRQGLRKIGSVFRRSPNSEDQSVSLNEAAPSPTANFRAVDEKDICVKFVVEENLSGPSSGKVFKEGSLSPEESSPESTSTNLRVVVGNEQETPGRNMKGMAKNFLKHAEKSAQTIKHALSRKGSRRFRSDISSVAEQDIPAESDSSDDESLSIPGDERVTVGTNPWPSACGSCSSKEHIARTGSSKHMEPAANSEDKLAIIRDEEQEESVDEDMTHPVGVGDGGAESSKPMASEENLEGERR